MKNHLLQGSFLHSEYSQPKTDQFNNETIMNKNNSTCTAGTEIFPIETQFVHTNADYKFMEGLPLAPNPSRQAPNDVENVSYTQCIEELHNNEKILSDIMTKAPIMRNPTKLLVTMSPQRQWYHMDVENTSFVIEELFLASLENEGATKRLAEHITTIDQSNPCKLTTFNSLNDISGCGLPYEATEIKFAHDKLDTMDELLLSQRLHKGVADLHNNEIIVGAHETYNKEKPIPNSTISKGSNTLGHHSPISHIENTKSSIITKNMVKVKVKSQAKLENNQMDDYPSKGSKDATSTRKRFLEPTINILDDARILGQQNSSTQDHPSLFYEWHNTKHDRDRDKRGLLAGAKVSPHAELVVEIFENRGQNDASTMINQHNKSNLAQQPRHGPRKVNIPQKFLKSVYERCDLDSVRPPGYTILCNAQPKGSPIKHSKDNIQMIIRAPSPLRDEPMPLQHENVDAINSQSTFKEEGSICHDDASGNKENIANGNEYVDLCSQGSEEELNILASLERLDYKLATINGKSMNSERNSMNSRQLSSKSTQSAPPVLIQRGTTSSPLGKKILVIGKQKNFPCNPPRPSVSFVSTPSII